MSRRRPVKHAGHEVMAVARGSSKTHYHLRRRIGKVLELVFDLWAITVVASLAGSFGAFFHARSKEMNDEMAKAEALLKRGIEREPGPHPAGGAATRPGR